MSIESIAKPINEKTIREIPAFKVMSQSGGKTLVREAAYARVSTNNEEQQTSYELQKKYYEQEIRKKPGTQFVKVYCDEESGKSIKGRDGFVELINDCRAGKIDRIITKSVSRFARNMVECMTLARELKNKGITIYFESQGIDTKDESSFVILSILAALAEEDIRTISNNVKWGIRKRYKEGVVHMSGRMLGYDIKRGQFTIVPDEVDIVRQIFNDYLNGMTVRQIKAKLEEQGIPTARGKMKWQHSTLDAMLRNEKYVGDVILQKTFKVDVLSPRQVNNGQIDKYEIRNNHVGIIDRETFNAVQAEMNRREYEKISLVDERLKYSSKYPFSAKIECGECGTKFRRHCQQHGDKKTFIWVCIKHQLHSDECSMRPIKEESIEKAFVQVLNGLVADRERIMNGLRQSIKIIIENNPIKDTEKLEQELEKTEKEMIELCNHTPQTSDDQRKNAELIRKAASLREEIEINEKMKGTHDRLKFRVAEIGKVLKLPFIEYNGNIFKSLIEKVVVNGKKSLKFIFKCGIEQEIEID